MMSPLATIAQGNSIRLKNRGKFFSSSFINTIMIRKIDHFQSIMAATLSNSVYKMDPSRTYKGIAFATKSLYTKNAV